MKWDDKTRWNWTKLDVIAGVLFLITTLSFPVLGLLKTIGVLTISDSILNIYLIVAGILSVIVVVYVGFRST